MPARLTPAQAATAGHLTVNGCVLLAMLGIPAMAYVVTLSLGFISETATVAAAATLLISMPLSWLVWSLLVPRWRVWAYERVDDLDELKMHAISVGLIWPDGHKQGRTEIRTREQQQRIRAAEERWAAKGEGATDGK